MGEVPAGRRRVTLRDTSDKACGDAYPWGVDDESRLVVTAEVAAPAVKKLAALKDFLSLDIAVSVLAAWFRGEDLRVDLSEQLERAWGSEAGDGLLSRTFAVLEQRSILSKPNFSCCGSCARAEIDAERAARIDGTGTEVGFVAFHEQAGEGLLNGLPYLPLMFDAFDGGGEATRQVGQWVSDALEESGLKVIGDTLDDGWLAVAVNPNAKIVPESFTISVAGTEQQVSGYRVDGEFVSGLGPSAQGEQKTHRA